MLLFLINGLLEFTIKLVLTTESGMNQSISTLRKLDTDYLTPKVFLSDQEAT